MDNLGFCPSLMPSTLLFWWSVVRQVLSSEKEWWMVGRWGGIFLGVLEVLGIWDFLLGKLHSRLRGDIEADETNQIHVEVCPWMWSWAHGIFLDFLLGKCRVLWAMWSYGGLLKKHLWWFRSTKLECESCSCSRIHAKKSVVSENWRVTNDAVAVIGAFPPQNPSFIFVPSTCWNSKMTMQGCVGILLHQKMTHFGQ